MPVFLDAAESSGRPAVPPPRMRRVVFVALLSSDGRLALVADDPSGALPRWVLPSGSVRATETYPEAAVRVLRNAVGAMPVRGGTVEGCRWAQVPVPVGGAVEKHTCSSFVSLRLVLRRSICLEGSDTLGGA